MGWTWMARTLFACLPAGKARDGKGSNMLPTECEARVCWRGEWSGPAYPTRHELKDAPWGSATLPPGLILNSDPTLHVV
nr:hypothetical protein CFP56_01230 [Quercus suber]